MDDELELGRLGVWERSVEAVDRGGRRAEHSEDGFEEDAALERRGRGRGGVGGEVEVVEEVAREGDGRERRPRAVERVQLQLKAERENMRLEIARRAAVRNGRWMLRGPCRGRPGRRGRSRCGRGR